MPNYIPKTRQRLGHKDPAKLQHSPHPYTPPQYEKKQQMAKNSTHPPLSNAQRNLVQDFFGIFQYYARAIDTTMLTAIRSIATNMTTAVIKDLDFRMKQFLDYVATHPDAKIRFVASDMQLWIHLDDSYLSDPKARSRAGRYFYLSKKSNYHTKPTSP